MAKAGRCCCSLQLTEEDLWWQNRVRVPQSLEGVVQCSKALFRSSTKSEECLKEQIFLYLVIFGQIQVISTVAVLLFRCFWSKWLIRYLLLKNPHPFTWEYMLSVCGCSSGWFLLSWCSASLQPFQLGERSCVSPFLHFVERRKTYWVHPRDNGKRKLRTWNSEYFCFHWAFLSCLLLSDYLIS